MRLSDLEQSWRDGAAGPTVAAAMDLLVRYGEALGAECLVETHNVCGTVTASTPFMRDFAARQGGLDAVYSEFNLDSAQVVPLPERVRVSASHLQLGFDPHHPRDMGVDDSVLQFYRRSEAMAARMGVQMMNTCTPYQLGNVPTRGEHCAWMESSAVVYCNSVLGGRTNTEGRESTSAAMLTGRIPDWGLHRDGPRCATQGVQLEMPVDSVEDWGLLGYWMGHWVQDRVPLVSGLGRTPDLPRLKHFGAAASSSGGVEMFHLLGVTPEAPSWQAATGGRPLQESRPYGPRERAATVERLNATGRDRAVDYVMLGCPHYTIGQLWEAATLLEGRRVHADTALWIWTPLAIKSLAERNGTAQALEAAGARLMTDSCSAMSRAVPPGTRVVALDSAKQAHYLPAILGVQAWFGTTAQCIEAACTGRWPG